MGAPLRALAWIALAAHAVGAATKRRALQAGDAGAVDEPWCRQLAEGGELMCGAGSRSADLCPQACAAAAGQPSPAAAVCADLAAHGELACSAGSRGAEVCPTSCAAGQTQGDESFFRTNCLVLLQLDGGCAYDLSHDDIALPAHTHVSDVCPHECSGHGNCVAPTLDIAFLGTTDDSSGFQGAVELHGTACLDGGGVSFDSGGWATITPGQNYGDGAEFSVAFWVLGAPANVYTPHSDTSHAQALYVHPPETETSAAGGITLSLKRGVWLDAWGLHIAIANTETDYMLDVVRGATPKWTHIAIVTVPTQFRVYEDGQLITDINGDEAKTRAFVGTMELSSAAFLGGDPRSDCVPSFEGSVAMLQIYSHGLSVDDVQCVFDGGADLVRNQRMVQSTLRDCRKSIITGCTDPVADNFDASLKASVDDGSCVFEEHGTVVGEQGIAYATEEWRRIDLMRSYGQPIVLTGVVTRASTTQAVVRVRSVMTDPQSGAWYFEISAEQKSCHFARPPPTSEQVSYLVVEGGVSGEGWQAGKSRVRNTEWYRISYLREPRRGAPPVVISQVQTYDNRTQFVSTRHHFPRRHHNRPCVSAQSDDTRSYNTIFPQELGANKAVVVKVAAGHDAHIGFFPQRDGMVDCMLDSCGDMYEICIGGWDNSQSVLRKGNQGQNRQIAVTEDYLCPEQERTFWATANDGLIRVGRGDEIGAGEFMRWRDPNPITPLYAGVMTGFGGGGSWSVCHAGWGNTSLSSLAPTRNLAFYLQVQGEGVWCQDGEFFAEYFDNLDLSGNPLATQCEVEIPNWYWHTTSEGIPPALHGKTRMLDETQQDLISGTTIEQAADANDPTLFSARWTTRLQVDERADYVFSSTANRGSRIIVDSSTILDAWERWGSTFASETVQLSAGYHTVVYEYRSAYATGFHPTNSYASLSWSTGGQVFGAILDANSTNVTTTATDLYVDVGWLACDAHAGTIHGAQFLSGISASDVNLATRIHFPSEFDSPPHVFGSVVSSNDIWSHLRLSEASEAEVAIAIEYDTCSAVFAIADESVGWIALSVVDEQSVRVTEQRTLQKDITALLNISASLQLPGYFHWRNGSDPCGDRWSGIECRTDSSGTPRIVVLDIHNVDLTNQDMPWSTIAQLTALEEISMWDCGLSGEISAAFLCLLTQLQVLALNRNNLRGTLPECMVGMPLQVLYLSNNNFHGPLAELSPLGQYLKGVSGLSLERNRWAPLLKTEKSALADVGAPLQVETHEHERNWDFGFSYDWSWASGTAAESRLMAERQVSYRQWRAGVSFEGFYVKLDSAFPIRGATVSAVGIGRDGDFAANPEDRYEYHEAGDVQSSWEGGGLYMGCYHDRAQEGSSDFFSVSRDVSGLQPGSDTYRSSCAEACRSQGYRYYGLQWKIQCGCVDNFDFDTPPGGGAGGAPSCSDIDCPDVCGAHGEVCGRGNPACGWTYAVFDQVHWSLPDGSSSTSTQDTSCWSTLPALVPGPHTISEASTDRSSQGEAYFADRFCPGWSSFITPACDPDTQACDAASSGNAIYDGGNDMYDMGNLIVTNLMGDCSSDPHDCALGSLLYQPDFDRVPTNCFGAGGHYQMQQSDAMWVFFTTNMHDAPIDFMIAGNLGSDGSGTVTEYVFDEAPHMGFVKRECGDEEGDPSINHMIIIDSSQGRPRHSCDYSHGALGGGDCTGASSGLDDDIVSGIAPGSPILYLLYSTEGGSCIKEDEHRAIFDVAALCIRAANPFSEINRVQSVSSQVLVEVDIDDRGHIMFGGGAPYAGWTRGRPQTVGGPSGFANALQFADHDWLQLGDAGVDIAGNWTLDCWVQVRANGFRGMGDVGVLVASADSREHVSLHREDQRFELGGESADGDWDLSGVNLAAQQPGWVRLTVIADRSIEASISASFNVVEGPCELLQGGACVGRPSGYSDSESCTIQAPTLADGTPSTLSACPVFVTEAGFDMLNIDGIDYHGTNCPTGELASGTLISWVSDGSVAAVGWEICVDVNVSTVGVASQIPTAPHESYFYFIDGEETELLQLPLSMCEEGLCPMNFFAIGAQSDGTAPFPLPLHRLRIIEGAFSPTDLDAVGVQTGDLLRYQPENSRSVKLSRGTDALEITWNTIGWNAAAHDHVHVELDYLGGVSIRCNNVSSLWDRAISSTGAIADVDIRNWTSSALASGASTGLRVRYVDSDPCFDLWDGVTCSLSDWPVGTDDCAELLDCDSLSWAADAQGSAAVCGSSILVGTFGSSDMCVRESSYTDAASLCTEMGGRLCTAAELEQGEGDPAACSYDSIFKWSWIDTPVEACPMRNQSLGMPGGDGAWFSFNPTAVHTYYEIQLRSEDSNDGSSFAILGVFDEHAEMIPGPPTTIHYVESGAMLRWNASQIRGAAFVHVSSAADDARYTMAAVLPPVYTWESVARQHIRPSQSFDAVELALQKDGAVAVDLQFSFPFFGLKYRTTWVSSFGMILLDQPTSLGTPFSGVDSIHNAVVAAAGEHNLDHSDAYVTASQASPTELKVSWHAPLFSSDVFSDVSVVLRDDGSVVITWEQIDLGNGGSLEHGLISYLSFGDFDVADLENTNVHDSKGPDSHLILSRSRQSECFTLFSHRCDIAMAQFAVIDRTDVSAEANICQLSADVQLQPSAELDVRTCTAGILANVKVSADNNYRLFVNGVQIGTGDNWYAVDSYDFTVPSGKVIIGVQGVDQDDEHADYQGIAAFIAQVSVGADIFVSDGSWRCTADAPDGWYLPAFDDMSWGAAVLWPSSDQSCNGCNNIWSNLKGGLMPGISADAQWIWTDDWANDQNAFCRLTLRTSDPSITSVADSPGSSALMLTNDAYVQLPSLELGGRIAVSAWVRFGRLDQGGVAGATLFNSFESSACLDSDQCRNSVDGTLDRGGWFAIGNDVGFSGGSTTVQMNEHRDDDIIGNLPYDLWSPNIVYDQNTAGQFWQGVHDEWTMVTVSVSGRAVDVYAGAEHRGSAALNTHLPRMMRHNNYIGASHNAPFQEKTSGVTMSIYDFRLYDRSLSANEVSALFTDPASGCCIGSGLKDAFGVSHLDLTAQAMAGQRPSSVNIASSAQGSASNDGTDSPGCAGVGALNPRELDICGEISTVSDCNGVITDGVGPYGDSLDCGVRLEGFIGSTYTLMFEEFETEQDMDVLRVYDGRSSEAPLLMELSGKSTPAAITSTGRNMYMQFTSNDNTAAVGFRVVFSCTGTLVEYWKPADVAEPLRIGVVSAPVAQDSTKTECLSGVLMSVQCCADAAMSCSNARVTGVGLSGTGLRGSIPEAVGSLGALRSLKLHDNFLTGTLPSALERLHLLRELQLSHNQFTMQDRESLSAILGGLMHLRTLDLGMSDEKEDLSKTIVQPTPPLACFVGEPCTLQLSTRTVDGLQLPHGGLQVHVTHADTASQCICEDRMDGTYSCLFSPVWTSHKGEFDFILSADGEEFVPLRALVDPTTGVESTVETYGRLSVIVPPIKCTLAHSYPNDDGSQCVCEAGYYKFLYQGGWSCEHCVRGEEPTDLGTRCQSCTFGKFSATGQSCDECPPGQEPNQDSGADDCVPCGDTSFGIPGKKCEPCPTKQVADSTRTRCVCPPRDTYNSTAFDKNQMQCIGKQHHGSLDNVPAQTICSPCAGVPCVECGEDGVSIKPGFSRSSTDKIATQTPWFVFRCPGEHACVNDRQQRCREGHTGTLCNECEAGYGMVNDSCEACGEVNSSPVLMIAAMLSMMIAVGLAYYVCCVRKSTDGDDPSALQTQLTVNPLQPNSMLQEGRLSRSSTTVHVQRTEDAVMLARVVYQPARILVGYMQVITQIGLVLGFELPPTIKSIVKLLKPLAMSIKSFFQLDCLGVIDFYQEWTVRTLIIPFVLLVLISLKYSFEIRRGEAAADAAGNLRANIFFIIFVLYPGICNEAFSTANCKINANLFLNFRLKMQR